MIVCLLSNMQCVIRAQICMLCNVGDYKIVKSSLVYSKYNDGMTAELASVPWRGSILFLSCTESTAVLGPSLPSGWWLWSFFSSVVKQLYVPVTMWLCPGQGTATVNAMKAYRGNSCKAPLVSQLGIRYDRSASQHGDHWKEAMCIPQPVCTFWGRDTFLAPAWDQTTIFGLRAHCPVNILAMLSLSSVLVKIACTHT
jgi:hypothetical protein